VGFVGDVEDRDYIGERCGGGLIDEDRLACGYGSELFEVGAAVDAFEEDSVGFFR
jgi:hypothetical protein